jgi:hypothetical protein
VEMHSTQDKAILEAAYNANPKPDKTARLELVKRVSLNEKEVQVSLHDPSPSRVGRRVLTLRVLAHRSGSKIVAKTTDESRVRSHHRRLLPSGTVAACTLWARSHHPSEPRSGLTRSTRRVSVA